MCEKCKNGAEYIPRYKNKNLNKIQRSNEWVAQDKESLERKKVRKFVAFLVVAALLRTDTPVDKKLSKGKHNFCKTKGSQCVAFLTGGEDRLNVNRTAKNTLVLRNFLRIQPYFLTNYRIEFNLQKKRIILKTLVLSWEANTYLNENRAAKNKLVLTKIRA